MEDRTEQQLVAQAVSAEQPVCFTGTFEHTLDGKGRVSLPAKIRKQLPTTLKTVLSFDKKSVLVFSPEAYVKWWRDGIFHGRPVDPRSKQDTALLRFVTRNAIEVDVDSAGRICIDARLREIVGLSKDVTIIGCDDHLEIMDRAVADAGDDELLAMDFMID